jgi:hypothetical protein
VQDERAIAAEPGGDRRARLRVQPDLARQPLADPVIWMTAALPVPIHSVPPLSSRRARMLSLLSDTVFLESNIRN